MNDSKPNIYAWNAEHKRQLSTGAVIMNSEGKILVMRLERVEGKYYLPAKSMQPGVAPEMNVLETFKRTGWNIEIENYLGTTITEFPTSDAGNITKTTLWFKAKPISEVARDPEDRDHDAEVQWKTKDELMEIFASQAHISTDVDQRQVIVWI